MTVRGGLGESYCPSTFPETAKISVKTLTLRLEKVVLSRAALAARLTTMHGVAPTSWLYFAGSGGPFPMTPRVYLPAILR